MNAKHNDITQVTYYKLLTDVYIGSTRHNSVRNGLKLRRLDRLGGRREADKSEEA